MFTAVHCTFSPHFDLAINHYGAILIAKNKLMSVFHAACDFHNHFDTVMTQFIINKRTETLKN